LAKVTFITKKICAPRHNRGCDRSWHLLFHGGHGGLLRFPDPLTRLHALTKADRLGLGFIAVGLLAALKLIPVWLLVQLAGATVA
jgi:multisubunit Na+/H+ antiporter MnhG subunit